MNTFFMLFITITGPNGDLIISKDVAQFYTQPECQQQVVQVAIAAALEVPAAVQQELREDKARMNVDCVKGYGL